LYVNRHKGGWGVKRGKEGVKICIEEEGQKRHREGVRIGAEGVNMGSVLAPGTPERKCRYPSPVPQRGDVHRHCVWDIERRYVRRTCREYRE
jgi:hypothetical protein